MVINTTILLISVGIYVVIYWRENSLCITVKRRNYFIIIYMNDYLYVYIFIYMIKKTGGTSPPILYLKNIF